MSSVHGPLAASPRLVRVLAVDDSASFLALIRDVVEETAHLELVGNADSGERAVEAARLLRADLVLMDIRMPGLSGVEAARRIKAIRPSTMVVLISTMHPDDLALDVDDTVADAFVWKSQLSPKVLDELWLGHGGGRHATTF